MTGAAGVPGLFSFAPAVAGAYAVTYNNPGTPSGGDDSTALQAALSAPGVLAVPRGFRYQAQGLQATKPGTYLIGFGAGGQGPAVPQSERSTIAQVVGGTSSPLLTVPQGMAHGGIWNLELDGQKASQSSGTQAGVLLNFTDYAPGEECQWHLENLYAHSGFGASNIYLGQGRRAIHVYQGKFHDASGIVLDINGTDHRFYGMLVSLGAGGENIRISGGSCHFYGCDSYSATSVGLLINTGATEVKWFGGKINLNGTQGVFISNSSNQAIELVGVSIAQNSQASDGAQANFQLSSGSAQGVSLIGCSGLASGGGTPRVSYDILVSSGVTVPPYIRNWAPSPAAALLNGVFSFNQTALTGTVTLVPDQKFSTYDATGGNVIINLPNGFLPSDEPYTLVRKDSSANTVTVQAGAGATLQGGSFTIPATSLQRVQCVGNGLWYKA